ncbi:peptidoglycan binding domain protein [Seiridium cupressi]
MQDQRMRKRLVVLVDGTEQRDDQVNPSSIRRLHNIVTDGITTGPSGEKIAQVKKYYAAIGKAPRLADKFKGKVLGDDTDDQIKRITQDICTILESPDDELFFLGSGHGSFVARAVAGIMHYMGLPRRESLNRFDDLFECACALVKARAEDDNRKGPKLLDTLQTHTCGCPRIEFIGLLECLKTSSTSTTYDTSFVSSIKNLRVALALNENRSNKGLEILEIGQAMDMTEHTFVQAWFIGAVDDICGGVQHDGLSLYPLQWILIGGTGGRTSRIADGPYGREPTVSCFPAIRRKPTQSG